jgi:hypothetical protein
MALVGGVLFDVALLALLLEVAVTALGLRLAMLCSGV